MNLDQALQYYDDLKQETIRIIKTYPSQAAFSRRHGLDPGDVNRFLQGSTQWSYEKMSKVLKMGACNDK